MTGIPPKYRPRSFDPRAHIFDSGVSLTGHSCLAQISIVIDTVLSHANFSTVVFNFNASSWTVQDLCIDCKTKQKLTRIVKRLQLTSRKPGCLAFTCVDLRVDRRSFRFFVQIFSLVVYFILRTERVKTEHTHRLPRGTTQHRDVLFSSSTTSAITLFPGSTRAAANGTHRSKAHAPLDAVKFQSRPVLKEGRRRR